MSEKFNSFADLPRKLPANDNEQISYDVWQTKKNQAEEMLVRQKFDLPALWQPIGRIMGDENGKEDIVALATKVTGRSRESLLDEAIEHFFVAMPEQAERARTSGVLKDSEYVPYFFAAYLLALLTDDFDDE